MYTPREFVVTVLKGEFKMTEEKRPANEATKKSHRELSGQTERRLDNDKGCQGQRAQKMHGGS